MLFRSESVAKYAAQNFHKRLVAEESYKERNWELALKIAFLGTDEDLRTGKFFSIESRHLLRNLSLWKAPLSQKEPGSCVVTALLTRDNKIYVVSPWNGLDLHHFSLIHPSQANAGDSRSVLSVKGAVKPLSFDHKPTLECRYLDIYQFTLISLSFFFSGEGTDRGSWWLCFVRSVERYVY